MKTDDKDGLPSVEELERQAEELNTRLNGALAGFDMSTDAAKMAFVGCVIGAGAEMAARFGMMPQLFRAIMKTADDGFMTEHRKLLKAGAKPRKG